MLFAASCTRLPDGGQTGFSRVDSIPKSPNDRREYRALMLDNGLKIILVSDPDSDKAAASMDINAGSNADPGDFEGLAHFLEHMLFLGTEKFPEPGEYQEFISSNGGSHNAYTAFENTNYYFDVEKGSLAPALERFSQFFIAPLFNSDYVNRERNAVHSEYQSNLQDDGRRAYSIFKQVINRNHPLSQFSVGSLDTLRDNERATLRQALLDHYQRYYSANLMSLAIYGPQSLDNLESLARLYFSAVENRQVEAPQTDEALFAPGQLPMLLEIEPVRDARTLGFTFPIPVVRQYFREKPLNYLGNLLGHEGEGSLLSLLKARGWANGLSAGGGLSNADNASFSINVALTEEGIKHIDDIGRLVFQAIALVREQGIHEWLFEEQRLMAQISFSFQEPGRAMGTASSLSRRLQLFSPREVLTAAYAYENYAPQLYRDILSHLRPDNVLVTFTSNTVDGDRTDPLFGGKYRVSAIDDVRMQAWQEADVAAPLSIPEPNPFLPEDLGIRDIAGAGPFGPENKPSLIMNENGIRLWFKHDNEFQVPRANFYVYAMTPLVNDTLENSLLSRLAISLMNDKLDEYSYSANLAGLGYGVSGRARGFTIRLSGYNDKQSILLEEVLRTLQEADFEQDRFDIIKTEYRRGLENADIQTPYVRLHQKAQALLVSPNWSEEQRLAALEKISLEDVIAFVPRMLSDVNLQGFYHGNILEQDAREMMAIVARYLGVTSEKIDPPYGKVVNMEPAAHVVLESLIDHDDSAVVIYLQSPDDSLQTRATLAMLGTILRTPFFEELRTQQQLGYVVNAGTLPILDTNGLVLTIESPVADPITLEERINSFLVDYEEELAAMSADKFGSVRSGLLNNLRQDPQTLRALSSRFWSDILIEEYDNDSTLQMADAIAGITLEDVLEYYRQHVLGPQVERLVARTAGRPHRDDFAGARIQEQELLQTSGIRYIQDTIESINAYKDVSDFYLFRED